MDATRDNALAFATVFVVRIRALPHRRFVLYLLLIHFLLDSLRAKRPGALFLAFFSFFLRFALLLVRFRPDPLR